MSQLRLLWALAEDQHQKLLIFQKTASAVVLMALVYKELAVHQVAFLQMMILPVRYYVAHFQNVLCLSYADMRV
jgi:hypothetical protein